MVRKIFHSHNVIDGSFVPSNSPVKFSGSSFSSSAYPGQESPNAFDNNTSTYWAANGVTPAFIGLDLAVSKSLSSVKFYATPNLVSRLVDAIIQGSNISGVAGFVDLFTITSQPTPDVYNDYPVTGNYRYVRVLSNNQPYFAFNEMEVWGTPII
jgi:hypothetical protein